MSMKCIPMRCASLGCTLEWFREKPPGSPLTNGGAVVKI
jgi:hypothetical protein